MTIIIKIFLFAAVGCEVNMLDSQNNPSAITSSHPVSLLGAGPGATGMTNSTLQILNTLVSGAGEFYNLTVTVENVDTLTVEVLENGNVMSTQVNLLSFQLLSKVSA